MVKQGYAKGDIEVELQEADRDWGGKFEKRPDGKERLSKMVRDAEGVVAAESRCSPTPSSLTGDPR